MKKKILVVDDDPSVRGLIASILFSMGFEAVEAVDGIDGLQKFKDNPDVKLIISDNNMPKMEGVELAEKIKNEHLELPFILMSGEAEPAGHRADWFLAKPFTLGQFKQAVSILIP